MKALGALHEKSQMEENRKEIKEHWLAVKGYEGLYEVSDWGNVRSLNYRRNGEARLLKPIKNTGGYLLVGLYKDKKMKQKQVHRLVAEAFVTNQKPDEYKEINHKSECPMLNFACVLEWCDRKYNLNYGTRAQRQADAVSKPVDQYDRAGNFIRHWKSITEASKQLGIHNGNMNDCAHGGRHKTAGGYVWEFAKSCGV